MLCRSSAIFISYHVVVRSTQLITVAMYIKLKYGVKLMPLLTAFVQYSFIPNL